MIIKLLPMQVPTFWENIKVATVRADAVKENDWTAYLNELLHALLNEKAQCWIRMDDQKVLKAILITKVVLNKLTAVKHLVLQSIYSYEVQEDLDIWKEEFELIKQFMIKENCSYATFDTKLNRIAEINKYIGFKESYRTFVFKLGGV